MHSGLVPAGESSREPQNHKPQAGFKHKPFLSAERVKGNRYAFDPTREIVISRLQKLQKKFRKTPHLQRDKPRRRCYAFVQTGYAFSRPVAQVLGGTLASTALRQTESANKKPSKAELRLCFSFCAVHSKGQPPNS
ncbi:MAG: hypothetical protein JO216_01655 [Hyphomicrobiales bacterium]|nr:hypothetical protein [Hyphomicrobiales bacterium]